MSERRPHTVALTTASAGALPGSRGNNEVVHQSYQKRARKASGPRIRDGRSDSLADQLTCTNDFQRHRNPISGSFLITRRPLVQIAAPYKRWAPEVERGFLWAASFLTGEMIFEARDVPYRTQLVPLAAIHVALGGAAEAIGKVEKIRRWYWCGVLGELYGGAIETRFANDLQHVHEWCSGGEAVPITVYDSSFDPGRLLTLRTRNSAAYKGVYALLMRGGSKDWGYDQDITIASHHSLAVDIHHVFPKKWCLDNAIDELKRESIVNKTAISATTNRKIGGRAPSRYLPLLLKDAETDEQELRRRIEQHHIDYDALATDDFDAHFEARRQHLLELISKVMGKEVIEQAVPSLPDEYELEDEELTDEDAEEAAA